MNCKFCNIVLTKKRNQFCTKSCSASFNNSKRNITENHRNKVRQTQISKYDKKYCIICVKELTQNRRRKTCSDDCLKSFKLTNKPPLTSGGYRKGAGRGKHGWYDKVYFDSTWELAFYIYCKDHDINIVRCNEKFQYEDITGVKRMYHPDFRVNGKLTEIKGYYNQHVAQKLKFVNEPIDVLYKENLKWVFSYVENKTNLKIKHLYKLYGDPVQN